MRMHRRRFCSAPALATGVVLGVAGLLLGSCSYKVPIAPERDVALARITNVDLVMRLTGESSPNRTDQYNVYGADLGSILEHKGKIYFVFGDTFGSRSAGQIGAGGTNQRSNTMAFTSDTDASDGITIEGMIPTSTGSAKQLISSPHNRFESTKIPTYGVSANGNIYLYFMSVAHWGDHGVWVANYSGVARSVDDGQNFEIVDGLEWPGISNFIQVAIAPVDEYLFFWAIPSGRFGGVQLMRVDPVHIEELGEYEYFAGVRGGKPTWSSDPDNARTIVESPVGELSVVWNDYLQRWIMTYLNEEVHALELREAKSPWGPWSEPYPLVFASQRPGLYGAYMHPIYFEENGRIIYFNMSMWEPYNVFLMRAELERRE